MPEASSHFDDLFARWENYIGAPRKLFHVQSVAVTHLVQPPPNQDFRFCILTTNRSHIPTSSFGHVGEVWQRGVARGDGQGMACFSKVAQA